MQNYVIISDSTADLTPKLVEQLGVQIIPFEFSINGKTYFDYPDARELDIREFYAMVRAGKAATTSLVNTERFLSIFEPVLAAGSDALYLAFSSGLTGSVGCALTAQEELAQKYPDRKLIVIDTLAASMGQGLFVYLAVQQKNNGLSIDELAQWALDTRDHLCHWVVVDDLNHLHRGGRVSAASAVIGGMLNIKPIIHVDNEGHLVPVDKVRGRAKALERIVKVMQDTAVDPAKQVIFISHGDCEEDCKLVADMVKKRLGVKEIYTNFIGPVIGAHSGPGTMALFFLGTQK